MIDLKEESARIYGLTYDTERESEWQRVAWAVAGERDIRQNELTAANASIAELEAGYENKTGLQCEHARATAIRDAVLAGVTQPEPTADLVEALAAERDRFAAELASLAYVPAGPPCALRDCRDLFGVVQISGDIWWVYRIDWCAGAWLRNIRGVELKLGLDQLDRPVLPLKRRVDGERANHEEKKEG